MSIKRLLSGMLVLVLLLVVAVGCGSGTAEPAGDKTQTTQEVKTNDNNAEKKPYELSVAWWGGEARHKKTLSMIDMYMEKYPEATVVSQYAAYNDYWVKMATQAASNNLPDVYLVQLTYIGEYASKGLMRPLQDLVDAGKIDVSSYTAGALSSSSYNGELVGITLGDTASGLVYNQTILDKVGVKLPAEQMTYSQMKDLGKELVSKLDDGIYAFDYSAAFWMESIEAYARSRGCYGMTNETGDEIGYTKEILKDFFAYHKELYDLGAYGPIDIVMENKDKQWADSLAGKGKIAVWVSNVNQGKIFQDSVEDTLGMARIPIADNPVKSNIEVAVPSTWAIFSKSDKVDEGAQFINFMVNDWPAQEIYNMDIGVPGSTKIQDNLIAGMSDTDPVDIMKKREIELMNSILSSIEPFNGRPSGYSIVISDFQKKVDEVMYGNMTVDQAVDAHFDAVSTLLKTQ